MPVNISLTPVVICSNFCSASGVAPVKASAEPAAIQAPMSGGCMKGTVRVVGMNSPKRSRQKGRGPGGDGHREGRLHEGAPDQRRIHHVVAQPAEQGLAQPDRDEAGHRGHPQRESPAAGSGRAAAR